MRFSERGYAPSLSLDVRRLRAPCSVEIPTKWLMVFSGVGTHERPVVVAAGPVCLPNGTADHAVVSQQIFQENLHTAAIAGVLDPQDVPAAHVSRSRSVAAGHGPRQPYPRLEVGARSFHVVLVLPSQTDASAAAATAAVVLGAGATGGTGRRGGAGQHRL